jgi:hypothetical protein
MFEYIIFFTKSKYMETPRLIEPTARNFLSSTLQKCHDTRITIYTYAFNIIIFVSFVLVFGTALYYCYKNKPTEYEKQQQMLRDQQYILSKIRYYQGVQADRKTSSITQLPML